MVLAQGLLRRSSEKRSVNLIFFFQIFQTDLEQSRNMFKYTPFNRLCTTIYYNFQDESFYLRHRVIYLYLDLETRDQFVFTIFFIVLSFFL